MPPQVAQQPRSGSGMLHKAGVVFVIATISGLLFSLFLLFQPQSLDGIGGMDTAVGGRDVSAILRESQQRQVPVTLSEAEINQWLARTLETKQGGRFEDSVEFKRVVVRLTEGLAEVVMERELGGRTMTVSMFFLIKEVRDGNSLRTELNFHGGGYASWLPSPARGGRFGKLPVPQGFLRLVMPSYEALAETLSDELDNGFKRMVHIRFEDKQITLDPRIPRRNANEVLE